MLSIVERRVTDAERWARTSRVTALAVAAIVLGAVLVRLQDLMLVPRMTDETEEILIGFRIFRGEALPLVGVDTYIGALFNYLVAASFYLFGPHPETGRLLVLAFGALGVVPTYLLGRSVGESGRRGQFVGLLAALLLAGSATDIVITSRLAYSNSLTPCFTTTGLWLLHRAVQHRSGQALAVSGLAFGLALQTHVAALVIWPGLGIYLLLHRRRVSPRWVIIAAGLGLVVVANIVVFNLNTGGATLHEILYRSSDYGGAPSAGLAGWPDRVGKLLRAYAIALGGRVSEYVEPQAIVTVPVLAYAGLGLLGLGVLARRREWILVLVIVSGLLAISLLNARLEPIVARSRHYAQLLPIGLVAVAVGLGAIRDVMARHIGPSVATAIVVGLTVTLLAMSQWELQTYLADRLDRPDKNNRDLLQAVDALVQAGDAHERVYLDGQLGSAEINSNRRGLRDFAFLLTIRGQEFDIIDVAQRPLPLTRSVTASRLIVLSQESTPIAEVRYRLAPVPDGPNEGARFRVFRAFPLDAAPTP